MAILSDVPGLTAKIIVEGNELQEHDDWLRPQPKSVTKYVEAHSEQEFGVHFKFSPPIPADRPLSTKIFLDGNLVDEPLLRPDEIHAENGFTFEGSVSKVGRDWVVQKFRFSGVTLEGDRQLDEEELKIIEDLGQVELQFYWLENPKVNPRASLWREAFKTVDKIPEKAAKGDAISHQATLCEPKATIPLDVIDADYAEDDPFATFIFKYRSIDALKALYVIPRTPSPVPPSQREIHELNDDEVRREVLRLQASQQTQSSNDDVRIKRERDEDDDLVYMGKKRLRRLPRDGDEVIALD